MPTNHRFSLFSLLTYLTVASLVRLGWIEKQTDLFQYNVGLEDAPSVRRIRKVEHTKQFFDVPSKARASTSTGRRLGRPPQQQQSQRKLLNQQSVQSPSFGSIDERKWIASARSSMGKPATATTPSSPKNTLVIATFPSDIHHLLALWSQLECFTEHVDVVIISAPAQATSFLEEFVDLALSRIPHFVQGATKLRVEYQDADQRFDTGLWCNALSGIPSGKDHVYGLINDSVFALKPFSGVLDELQGGNRNKNADNAYTPQAAMTSLLSYTTVANQESTQETVMDSTFRGFNQMAMFLFQKHVCRVPAQNPLFECHEDNSRRHPKLCIKRQTEMELSRVLHQENADINGLWPQAKHVPPYIFQQGPDGYAKWLVEREDFPAMMRSTVLRKEKQQGQSNMVDTDLQQCTRHILNRAEIEALLE
jgi:hypothetical protein